jgi:hypothetical protein
MSSCLGESKRLLYNVETRPEVTVMLSALFLHYQEDEMRFWCLRNRIN